MGAPVVPLLYMMKRGCEKGTLVVRMVMVMMMMRMMVTLNDDDYR